MDKYEFIRVISGRLDLDASLVTKVVDATLFEILAPKVVTTSRFVPAANDNNCTNNCGNNCKGRLTNRESSSVV
jgi:hypothetical protein